MLEGKGKEEEKWKEDKEEKRKYSLLLQVVGRFGTVLAEAQPFLSLDSS